VAKIVHFKSLNSEIIGQKLTKFIHEWKWGGLKSATFDKNAL